MKKTNKKSLRKSADTLILVTTRMIEELEEQESYNAEDVERLSVAFSHALSVVSQMETPPKKTAGKKESSQKEECPAGQIVLPPVMECET